MLRFALCLVASACLSTVGFAAGPEILPVPDVSQIWDAIESLEDRVTRLEMQSSAVTPVIVEAAPVVKSEAPVVVSYSARWHNNDGLSPRQHAIDVHGFDAGLSNAQLAAQHDAYHDAYGAAHPASVSWSSQTAIRTRTTTVQSPYASNCPGGVCPTSRTRAVQSSGGLLGFGIIRRR